MINFEKISKSCDDILKNEEIRFCGLIDSSGKLVHGGFREGVVPFESDENQQQMFQELASRITKKKKF